MEDAGTPYRCFADPLELFPRGSNGPTKHRPRGYGPALRLDTFALEKEFDWTRLDLGPRRSAELRSSKTEVLEDG